MTATLTRRGRPPMYVGVTCRIDGCENVVRARGWCGLHYQRWKRTGDPTALLQERKGPMQAGDGDERHGTVNGYVNLKCRCDQCRRTWAADRLPRIERRKARLASGTSKAEHGKASTYFNHGCRCEPCTRAMYGPRSRWSSAETQARVLNAIREMAGTSGPMAAFPALPALAERVGLSQAHTRNVLGTLRRQGRIVRSWHISPDAVEVSA